MLLRYVAMKSWPCRHSQLKGGLLCFGSVRAMASTRLLCLFGARTAGSTKTLAKAGCSRVCSRRSVCSSPSRLQGCMSAWVIDQYGTNGLLRHTEEVTVPTISSASEVMIQVHAASLNPLDISMRGKWYSWKSLWAIHTDSLSHTQLVIYCWLFTYLLDFRWLWSYAA